MLSVLAGHRFGSSRREPHSSFQGHGEASGPGRKGKKGQRLSWRFHVHVAWGRALFLKDAERDYRVVISGDFSMAKLLSF